VNDARLHRRPRPYVSYDLGQSFTSITEAEEHVFDAPVTNVGEHSHPKLRAFTTGPGPEPQNVFLTPGRDCLLLHKSAC